MTAKRRIAAAFSVLTAALAGSAGSAFAQEKRSDFGKLEYDFNCASCHGINGKGDGPYKQYLTKSPSDLTVLSWRNGGVFPMDKVYSIIDGREELGAHGPRDMPIWGMEFRARDGLFGYTETPYGAESHVRVRILALADYIYRLQAKSLVQP